jgi:4-aminobutyrate aminotransferase/(S)-3-amino-2-methylpropionate transaminase
MASLLRTAGRIRPAVINSNAPRASRVAPAALRRRYASAAAAFATPDAGEQPFFPDEPEGPIVQTQIPGPESKKAVERLSKVFDTRSLNMMADYSRSYGN